MSVTGKATVPGTVTAVPLVKAKNPVLAEPQALPAILLSINAKEVYPVPVRSKVGVTEPPMEVKAGLTTGGKQIVKMQRAGIVQSKILLPKVPENIAPLAALEDRVEQTVERMGCVVVTGGKVCVNSATAAAVPITEIRSSVMSHFLEGLFFKIFPGVALLR